MMDSNFNSGQTIHAISCFFVLLRPAFLAGAVVAPTYPVRSKLPLTRSPTPSIAHRYSEVQFDNMNFGNGTYDEWAADGQSICAMFWLANEIDRRYSGQGIRACSVQPGGIQTGLLQHISEKKKKKKKKKKKGL